MNQNENRNQTEESRHCFWRKDIVSESGQSYKRLAVQTHFVQRGESYIELVKRYVLPVFQPGDILSISEKVITMCQNNIVEKKDVHLGFWAKTLSKFASSNSYGVAMDQPYKLQLAINLCGLPRILLATFCSAVTKPFGIHGVFYKVAGHGIAGIDGFYPGSSFELYHDIALLNPIEPDRVCNEIQKECGVDCMIVDANDLNVELLGKSDTLKQIPNQELCSMIKDNPAGQEDELTPFILIRKKTDSVENAENASA
ncbi:MAG: F420-0--gamma-glutamyl ligase [Thermocaproicibacter melissae]|jgi:F420-0:gamma-glutamyl ligase-like protein|uniref:F420-0--gamma-glutamyl ligase n=1 Tax=Thermocaproicibacter melissae TaxID=2966552 RepID=UPI003A0FDE01